jgi:hypothetical protein
MHHRPDHLSDVFLFVVSRYDDEAVRHAFVIWKANLVIACHAFQLYGSFRNTDNRDLTDFHGFK